jgi:biotin transport system substrate-specific component
MTVHAVHSPAGAPALRSTLVPRRGLLVDTLLVCAGTGLVAACAQISIPLGFTPVPLSGQTFAALLVGASLGSIRGMASLLLYLWIGVAGLPVYAGHAHGWHTFSGATGGYLVGFVAAAALTGWLAERGLDRRFSSSVSVMLTATVVIYACGLLWLHHVLHASWATTLTDGLYPFVPGDLFKLYLAALALPTAWKLVSRAGGGAPRTDR